ncbi:MAG: hypothetical protein AAF804_04200 [Bacteroidota bacterium]
MKHLLIFLIGLIGWNQALAQALVDTTFDRVLKVYPNPVQVLNHPHRTEALLVIQSNLKFLGVQLIDSTGDNTEFVPFSARYKANDWYSLDAYAVDAQGRYHLYYYDEIERTLRSRVYDPQNRSFSVNPALMTLSKEEKPISLIGPAPQGVVLATVGRRSSRVKLLAFQPGRENEIREWVHDLSKYEFTESPFLNLYSALLSMDMSRGKFALASEGISPFRDRPLSLPTIASDLHTYVDQDHWVFISHSETDYNLVIDLPFSLGEPARVERLSSPCKECKTSNLGNSPAMVYHQGQLVQFQASHKALGMQVWNLPGFDLLVEEVYGRRDFYPFEESSNSEARQTGLIFAPLQSVDSLNSDVVAGRFFSSLRQGRLYPSVTPIDEESCALRLTTVNDNEGAVFMAGVAFGLVGALVASLAVDNRTILMDFTMATPEWEALPETSPSAQELNYSLGQLERRELSRLIDLYRCGPYLWLIEELPPSSRSKGYRLRRLAMKNDW